VLPEIRDFVRSRKAALQGAAVAYFVVCMTMREDTPEHRAKAESYLDPLRAEVKPIDVGLFAGAVDYAKLEGGSKMMAKMVKLPAGDFRDWTAIGAWVDGLAAKLQEARSPQGDAGP
jgi:menaquinone-dependent protoporphyrinogen oxidase